MAAFTSSLRGLVRSGGANEVGEETKTWICEIGFGPIHEVVVRIYRFPPNNFIKISRIPMTCISPIPITLCSSSLVLLNLSRSQLKFYSFTHQIA
ncbi:hypothetical protein L6452_03852 [Arctium lappa]|uniref:Uncharacterized protein n=1 Tax=Arctium lappa TaxID=4217 RepID=A0ACB9FQ07_ARCLA|nr:hypothetical protein L6452_03852 [Arctium lappa]